MFSSRHYIEVANLIRNIPEEKVDKDKLINLFIKLFKEDNPRFNPIKFTEACFDDDWEDG